MHQLLIQFNPSTAKGVEYNYPQADLLAAISEPHGTNRMLQ